jgi:DNA processing protein
MEVAMGVITIGIDDEQYPAWLKEIADPPKTIYVRGNLEWGDRPTIAIVGTRKPTSYGVQVTTQLVEAIAKQSVIISGLAYGVDSCAHLAAVRAGGVTVAVLGSGIDDESIYPATNRGLALEILRTGGALISEYPLGMAPLPYHFPQRNRIIAGLSQKIVVVEASEGSGALITARLGLDYNREVLAVPGMVTSPQSWGPNQLIAEGAKPVLQPSDVVEISPEKNHADLTEAEEIVYNTLVSGEKTVDELARATDLATSEVNMIVTLLEMRGMIMQLGGGKFGVK